MWGMLSSGFSFGAGIFRLGGTQFSRCKGHSKWQNIKHTKQTNDSLKSSNINRHCSIIRFAISVNGRETDPKKNSALGKAIKAALGEGVPKATIDKAVDNFGKATDKHMDFIVRAPGGVRIAIISNIASKSSFQSYFSTTLRKNGAAMEPTATLRTFFEKKGVLLLRGPSSLEAAEETAIQVEAEEVYEVDEGLYEFITDPVTFPNVRDRLFKEFGDFEYLDAEVSYLPLQTVSPPPPEALEMVNKIKYQLQNRLEVISIHDNIDGVEE